MNKTTQLEPEEGNSKKYQFEAICNNEVYTRKLEDYLSGFYYLVSWKDYLKKENIWELVLVIQYLQRLVTTFYKKYLKKLRAIFLLIDSTLSMTRSVDKLIKAPNTKQK